MKISGLSNFSTINYPGKSCCVLFAKGCPLKCRYCYNKILLKEPEISWEELEEFLESRKNFLDAVVFSGGEPMMQYKELLEKVSYVKSLGYFVGLHLTGLNSDKEEFEKIIQLSDWIGYDFKGIKEKYKKICGLSFEDFERGLDIILKSGKSFEIRTTLDSNLTLEDLKSIEGFLLGKGVKDWFLQRVMLEEGTFEEHLKFDSKNINIKYR